MQHPDEGTIHSWLDGALPAAEAANVEAHVATCQSCAAAVAEARGFIAASSRILTALDDVPRGVLPAAPERKRDLRVFWRAAAAMLVVAGGSLVVMREGGSDARIPATTTQSAERFPTSAPPEMAEPTASGGSVPRSAPAIPRAAPAPKSARADSAAVAGAGPSSRAAAPRRSIPPTVAATAGIGAAADAAAPRAAASEFSANAEAVETNVPPLKLVSVERAPGVRRTTYEISPMVTVVLSEAESLQLSGVVVTGAQNTGKPEIRLRGNSTLQSQRVEAAPAAPPPPAMMDSRTGSDSASVRREAAAAKAATDGVVTAAASAVPTRTISWTEAGTGKKLSLTGNLSVERLQEIRVRIEKERAAAVKTP